MKLQSGPAFGAAIIGVGFAYLLHRSGKPLGVSILVGAAIGAADYVVLIWLKNRGINQ